MSSIIIPEEAAHFQEKKDPAIDQVVKMLNELLAKDPAAIACLMSTRIPCNAALDKHPMIVTSPIFVKGLKKKEGQNTIGALGLINAIVKQLTGHYVVSVHTDQDKDGHTIPPTLDSFGIFTPSQARDVEEE